VGKMWKNGMVQPILQKIMAATNEREELEWFLAIDRVLLLTFVERTTHMPHYEKAPITEALIDIRAQLSPELRFEDLQAVKKHLSADYPRGETRNLGEATLQFGQAVKASAAQRPLGLMFRNLNDTQVVQFRIDGYTFSRLKPYESWENLRNEAKRLWDVYREVLRPTKVLRVAVRYINQLELPGPKVEPEEYLNTYPLASSKLAPELRDFGPYLMSLSFHQQDLKGMLVLNEALVAPTAPDVISIVLDLDLFVDNPPVTNEQELWLLFEKLRERKNLYFEACITPKTQELIGPTR
jgi:uncharacterized protein (TIGR04255 family)